jgi:hypothetical protein
MFGRDGRGRLGESHSAAPLIGQTVRRRVDYRPQNRRGEDDRHNQIGALAKAITRTVRSTPRLFGENASLLGHQHFSRHESKSQLTSMPMIVTKRAVAPQSELCIRANFAVPATPPSTWHGTDRQAARRYCGTQEFDRLSNDFTEPVS